jgi:hypothetical protein
MIRFGYVSLLAALLADIGVGVSAANVIRPHTKPPAVDVIFDADYVQGLAKRGIAILPGYKPPLVARDAERSVHLPIGSGR